MRGNEISEWFERTRASLVNDVDAAEVLASAQDAVDAARRAMYSAECLLARALARTDPAEASRRFAQLDRVDDDVLSRFDEMRARQALGLEVDDEELQTVALEVSNSDLESSVGIDANAVISPFDIHTGATSEAKVLEEFTELINREGYSIDQVEEIAYERIESVGDAPVFHCIIAMARMARGDTAAAHQALEVGIARHPRSARLHGLLGELLYTQDRHDEALKVLRGARSMDPTSRPVRNLLALSLHQLEKYADETSVLTELLEDAPAEETAQLLARLAESLRRQERYEEALARIDRSVEIDPESGWAHGTRAQILRSLGDREGANVAAQRALDIDPEPEEWMLRIRIDAAVDIDDLDVALTTATRAVERFPGSATMLASRGAVRGRRDDLEGAVDDLQAAYDLSDEKAVIAPWLGRALADWAEHRRNTETTSPELVETFRRAIELLVDDPDNQLTARASLAETLRSTGETAAAITLATQLLEENPEYNFVQATLAQAHADAQEFATGLELIEDVLERVPDYVFAHQCKVCCLVGLDHITAALEASEQLLAFDENDRYGLVHHAVALAQLGEFEQSLASALDSRERGVDLREYGIYLVGALQNRADRPGAGRAELERAADLLPEGFVLAELGAALLADGERDLAMGFFGNASRAVRESQTASASDWSTIAWCHGALGDLDGSWRYMRQAEALEPSNPSVLGDQLVLLAVTGDGQLNATFERWMQLLADHPDPARAVGAVIELQYLIRVSRFAFDAEAALSQLDERVADVLTSHQRQGGTHVNS